MQILFTPTPMCGQEEAEDFEYKFCLCNCLVNYVKCNVAHM